VDANSFGPVLSQIKNAWKMTIQRLVSTRACMDLSRSS
jgi:hypothetical protein